MSKLAEALDSIEKLETPTDTAQSACNGWLCYICKKPTDSLSASPYLWPLFLEYPGGNGGKRAYHRSCVIDLIYKHFA